MKRRGLRIKFLTLLAVLVLTLTMGVALAAANSLELKVGDIVASPGTTVQVPVELTSTGQVAMLQFDLGFNNQLLSFQSVSLGPQLEGSFYVDANPVEGKQRVMIYNFSLQEIPSGTQTIATMTLAVAANAVLSQNFSLELGNVVMADKNINDLATQAVLKNGLLTIPAPAPLIFQGVSVDSTKKIVVITFSEDLVNNKNSAEELKAAVLFAANGTDFLPLTANDIVAINGNNLVVTFLNPLTGSDGKIKVIANALAGTGGSVQSSDLLAGPINGLIADPAILELALGSVTGVPGDTVQVPVYLTSEGQVTALQFDLGYDSQVLDFQAVALENDLPATFNIFSNIVDGKLRVMIYNQNLEYLPQGGQRIAILTFKVTTGTKQGQEYPLNFTNVVIAGEDNQLTSQATINHGKFSVPANAVLGDLSGDKKVDFLDLVMLAQAYGRNKNDSSWDSLYDLNNDGVLDIFDLVFLSARITEVINE